jgi:exonuclease SbcC
MKLIDLKLQNFRQHVDTRIEFRRGLTGIIGPNGAGKSTILEAIAWAVYGAAAARGTNDTIRFTRAPGRARVLVDLAFELGGHEFRVTRTLNNADVFLDGGITPVATGIGGVSTYLESRIGMTRDEFFNTYFTSQKELQFLAQLGPRDRGRFLAQVLGYERLRRAQELAKDRRKALQSEILGIREVLPDPEVLLAERQGAEQRLDDSRKAFSLAEQAHAARATQIEHLTPRWLEAQQKRERMREVGHEIDAARRDGEAAKREVDRASAELERIKQADQELAPLKAALVALPETSKECERLATLARVAERRRVLEENERDLKVDLKAKTTRLKELESAPELLKQSEQEQDALREQLLAGEQRLVSLRDEWTQGKQHVVTQLQTHRSRYEELKSQIAQLREAGPNGTCPICTRPLGREFDSVVGLLEDQLADVEQNGKWLRKRQTQLESKPQDLKEAEELVAALQTSAKAVADKLAKCQQAAQEIWNVGAEIKKKQEKLKELQAELQKLPGGYDAAQHKKADARLKELREIESRATRFEQILEARPVRERELVEATERAREALARLEAGAARLEEIAFDPKHFEQLRIEHEQVTRALHAAEIGLTDARARLEAAQDHVAVVEQAERAAEENRAKLNELEIDLKHHFELDAAFSQLRQELNDRVRPELGELASRFLTDITDGRYTNLEIDENYNVIVLDEGEEKPVISGGEEDIANLVLRIAISQMIAERAGQQLSVLFLDEVFGSLDLERRDNVIDLLHKLEDRFEQVILITHIETIREGLDHVIRVSYDERTGASVVAEESELLEFALK